MYMPHAHVVQLSLSVYRFAGSADQLTRYKLRR